MSAVIAIGLEERARQALAEQRAFVEARTRHEEERARRIVANDCAAALHTALGLRIDPGCVEVSRLVSEEFATLTEGWAGAVHLNERLRYLFQRSERRHVLVVWETCEGCGWKGAGPEIRSLVDLGEWLEDGPFCRCMRVPSEGAP